MNLRRTNDNIICTVSNRRMRYDTCCLPVPHAQHDKESIPSSVKHGSSVLEGCVGVRSLVL